MNVIELAIYAQLIDHRDTAESLPPDFVQSLKEFAALVRAAALEEAAVVCEDVSFNAMNDWKLKYKPVDQGRELGADECAAAIRALKEMNDE